MQQITRLVLIVPNRQASVVEIVIVLTILILAGVLSVVGPDTHDYDVNDRRGWWPGRR
jgi:hypothetical protein